MTSTFFFPRPPTPVSASFPLPSAFGRISSDLNVGFDLSSLANITAQASANLVPQFRLSLVLPTMGISPAVSSALKNRGSGSIWFQVGAIGVSNSTVSGFVASGRIGTWVPIIEISWSARAVEKDGFSSSLAFAFRIPRRLAS
jgi:hypothetical protein